MAQGHLMVSRVNAGAQVEEGVDHSDNILGVIDFEQ
jgi:hypothetical protein